MYAVQYQTECFDFRNGFMGIKVVSCNIKSLSVASTLVLPILV